MDDRMNAFVWLFVIVLLAITPAADAQRFPGLQDVAPSLSYALSPADSAVVPDRLAFSPNRPSLWSTLTKVVWVKGTVQIDSTEQWVLGVKNATIDSITFFLDSFDGLREVYVSGDHFAFHQRPYESEYFLFNLPGGHKEVTFYLRVRVKELTQLPVLIGTRDAWLSDEQRESVGEAIFFGGILVLVIYNLFIFLSTREVNYVIYSLTNLSASVLILTLDGYAFRYFWPTLPGINDLVPSMAAVNSFLYCLFFISFTRLNIYEPAWRKFFVVILGVFLLLIPGNLLFPGFGASVAYELIATPYIVVQLYVVYRVIRKGYAPAKYFFLGSCLYSAGGFLFIVANLNLLPIDFPVGLALKTSVLLEASLLSFALADQMNFLKNENMRITTATNLQLVAANLKLNEALVTLDLFVYRSSHDLRGPLMRLKGLANLFAADQLPNPLYLSKLRDTTDNLEQILDKHIVYNSLKNHALTYAEVVPGVIFQQLTRRVVPSDHACEWEVDPLLTIRTDEHLLKVILTELLHNAVTFRKEQEWLRVQVRGTIIRDDFEVVVEDNGIGIETEIQPRIFEMFYRGHPASQGSGIGLAIARDAATLLAGNLTLRSSAPGRTVFVLTIPKWAHEPASRGGELPQQTLYRPSTRS